MNSFSRKSALEPIALPTSRRIVALDGLRAIAVLMVFLHHALNAPLFMGVDLFFVISGFLITGILLERKSRGQSYFGHFYARRSRRILPPYLLLLLVSSLLFGIGWIAHWQWYAFFAVNIGASIGNIGHESLNVLWSLAVEEQFYLVWPFVVLLASERALVWIAVAGIVIAPVLRFAATPSFNTFLPIYYLTPFRMDLLCAGALMAVLLRRDARALQRLIIPAVLGIIGSLGALGYLYLTVPLFRTINQPWPNVLLYSLTLIACTSAVLIAIESRGLAKRLLCHPTLVYIGTISYTVYLIHMSSLYVVWNLHVNRLLGTAVALAISLAYASLSWFLFEQRMTVASGVNNRPESPATDTIGIA